MAIEVIRSSPLQAAPETDINSHSNGGESPLMIGTISSPNEITEFEQDIQRLKERLTKLRSLEATVFQEESAYKNDLVKKKKRLKELLADARSTTKPTDKLHQFKGALDAIEAARPIHVPFILWVAMGSAKLILTDRERIQYKASYERFKVFATVSHLLLSLILLFVTGHPWLDAMSNFFLLYAYSTMTLREHILRLNGSAMQLWWVWHHYLCVVLSGVLVVWPSGEPYYQMRTHLLLFMVYIAAVQILQYRYQMSRLYTLRALSRVGPMQTTTDSASVHIFNSLGFLLPFILVGHMLQFYTCYQFIKLYQVRPAGSVEWQVVAIGSLFGLIAFGNISTTLYTVYQKWRPTSSTAAGINRSRSLSAKEK